MESVKFKKFVSRLAGASEKIILSYFANKSLEVELKADESPVTCADREAEKIMREMIRKEYPEHGIIGEEFGRENETAEWVWMLDPIDGTITFTSGCPLFGTLICLLHQNRPVLGAINLPALRQICIGDTRETSINGVTVRMRETARLSEATLLATDIKNITKYQSQERFKTLLEQTKIFRTWGDCYGYFLLAGGWADIMLDPIMHPWDLMALVPIIQGAGGVITNWEGGDPATGESSIAANPLLHKAILEILNG